MNNADRVLKALRTLDKITGVTGSYSGPFKEFRADHYLYGAYVNCVLYVHPCGAVTDFPDCTEETLEDYPIAGTHSYPSIEAWAWFQMEGETASWGTEAA